MTPGSPPSADSSATLQEQVEEQAEHRKYGTFAGVFTPTLLTILGVIMYLRQGAVVGNAGLVGAWLVVGLVCGIVACTALSLSSITTNIRIGAGGSYSIISQSLGLEVGGSVGVPLYLSQALAATMYIFGFREGWQFLFPEHPAPVVVRAGELEDQIGRVQTADLDIFGLSGEPDFESARRTLRVSNSSCLFVRDSDEENVLA